MQRPVGSAPTYVSGAPVLHPHMQRPIGSSSSNVSRTPTPLFHSGLRASVGDPSSLSGSPQPPLVQTLFRPTPEQQVRPLAGRARVGNDSAPQLSGDPLTYLGVILQSSSDPNASPLLPMRRAQVESNSPHLSGAPTP